MRRPDRAQPLPGRGHSTRSRWFGRPTRGLKLGEEPLGHDHGRQLIARYDRGRTREPTAPAAEFVGGSQRFCRAAAACGFYECVRRDLDVCLREMEAHDRPFDLQREPDIDGKSSTTLRHASFESPDRRAGIVPDRSVSGRMWIASAVSAAREWPARPGSIRSRTWVGASGRDKRTLSIFRTVNPSGRPTTSLHGRLFGSDSLYLVLRELVADRAAEVSILGMATQIERTPKRARVELKKLRDLEIIEVSRRERKTDYYRLSDSQLAAETLELVQALDAQLGVYGDTD